MLVEAVGDLYITDLTAKRCCGVALKLIESMHKLETTEHAINPQRPRQAARREQAVHSCNIGNLPCDRGAISPFGNIKVPTGGAW